MAIHCHTEVTERGFSVPTATHKGQNTWRIPVLSKPGVGQPQPNDHIRALRGSWCFQIPWGQSSCEKAVAITLSPATPSTSPTPVDAQKLGEEERRAGREFP